MEGKALFNFSVSTGTTTVRYNIHWYINAQYSTLIFFSYLKNKLKVENKIIE